MPIDLHPPEDRAHRVRLGWLPLAVVLPITAIAGSLDRPSDPVRRFSGGPGVSNHPVNVVPSSAVSIPPGWHLGSDGSITCTTCHLSIPRSGSGGPNLREAGDGSSDPEAFCLNCHQNGGGGSAASAHWKALSRAHLMGEAYGESSRRGSAVDGASRDCLSCHDGVSALDAGHETGMSSNFGSFADKNRNHPIGVSYPRAGTRRVEVPLRPAAELPRTVRLPGGVVSCISCHDLYQTNKSRLSVPIEGSRLCLTCHDLD